MALNDLTDPDAVRSAMAEFDARGRDGFLAAHGFRRARGYFLQHEGRSYDSKAIAGVAHGYQHGTALTAEQFSGGDATVATRLEQFGFTVTRPLQLPDWATDELLLALSLYLRTPGRTGFSPTTRPVTELSQELRALRIFPDEIRSDPRFRNPSGVALKMHNFAAVDPGHAGKGMAHGGAADTAVWAAWASRPAELATLVAAIRANARVSGVDRETGEDEEFLAPEGRILYRLHRRYERDRRLVSRKKAQMLKGTGKLACEVCDFDTASAFGPAIADVLEVHHVAPLHKIGQSITGLSDLAVVCPTCHRVVHRHNPLITPAELRAKLHR